MSRIDRSYIGKGPVYIRDRANAGGFFFLGNTSVLNVSFEEEKKELKDFTSAGGGNANVLQSITGFTGSVTVHDYTVANLALFLRGSQVGIAAGSAAEEAHPTEGTGGEFIPLDFLRDVAETVTVVTTADAALVEGTDYTIENNGIVVIAGGGIDATGIKVTYTKAIGETMEALTASGKEFELYFNGVNEAQGGELLSARVHRIKFSPAQDLNFIGDEFGEMSADFEALSDTSITGAGISRFMKVQTLAA